MDDLKQQRLAEYSRRIDSGLFGVSLAPNAVLEEQDIVRQLKEALHPRKVKLIPHGFASNGEPYYRIGWDSNAS